MAHLAHDPAVRPDLRTALDLRSVLPKNADVNEQGHLSLAGVDLVRLAQDYGTALYVMDEDQIRQALRVYLGAFALRWPNFEVAYAGKAFLCRAICRLLAEEGGWLDVSSGGELAVALAAGFDAAHVIVHGNNKTETELREAIEAGAGLIVADCFEEIERIERIAGELGRVQALLLRLKPGVLADTHDYIQTGGEDSKFGFGITDGWAEAAFEQAMNAGHIELRGLHCHIGSQILAYGSYEKTVEVLFAFIEKLWATNHWLPRDLDFGGGVGVAYQSSDIPPGIESFVEVLVAAVGRQCERLAIDPERLRLIVEPGRSIVATAGLTLYRVGAIKELPETRTWVAVDGGLSDNIRTALYDAHPECLIAERADQPRDALVTVCGKHCESGDVVAIDASLQTPQVGDTLVVTATGAYNHSMASNYNCQVRPAVLWLKDGAVREILRRETYEDLMRCEVEE